uniref:Vomeronasal type-1 receptor n=1 Tax=Oryctolagus cuniculus TaxID=9986 RepID=A0A5F9D739_RABIT
RHLTVANPFTGNSEGILQTMMALGLRPFLSDAGCKFIFHIHRSGQGVSIGTTHLLSIFQAISISPISSSWTKLKMPVPTLLSLSDVLCLIIHTLNMVIIPFLMSIHWNSYNIVYTDYGLEYADTHNNSNSSLYYSIILHYPDLYRITLSCWASGFMVFILYKHKWWVQHIHRSLSPKSFPVSRATHSILIIVSTYYTYYS